MPTSQISTLTFRIAPARKDALRRDTKREHRSIVSTMGMLLLALCRRNGITIAAQKALPLVAAPKQFCWELCAPVVLQISN